MIFPSGFFSWLGTPNPPRGSELLVFWPNCGIPKRPKLAVAHGINRNLRRPLTTPWQPYIQAASPGVNVPAGYPSQPDQRMPLWSPQPSTTAEPSARPTDGSISLDELRRQYMPRTNFPHLFPSAYMLNISGTHIPTIQDNCTDLELVTRDSPLLSIFAAASESAAYKKPSDICMSVGIFSW